MAEPRRTTGALIALAVVLLVWGAPGAADALEPGARVQLDLADGTEAVGVLVRAHDDGDLLVRTECGELHFDVGQIERVVVDPELWSPPYRVAGETRHNPDKFEAGRWRRLYLDVPQYRDYLEGRLQMVDKRGRWIGPTDLGYRTRLLDGRRRFHVIELGVPGRRLTVRQFVARVQDDQLTARFDFELAAANKRIGTGIALMGAGVGSIVLGIVLNAIGSPQGPGTGGQPYGAPFITASIPLFVIGGVFVDKGARRIGQLDGTDVSDCASRDRGWTLVQGHNGDLRQVLGLPDDERLDAP